MSALDHARLCAEVVHQSDLLGSAIADADLSTPVPSCPGWNVGQLVRHVDGGHRWAGEIVRTRATAPISDVALRDLSAYTDSEPAQLQPTLAEGARLLAQALVAAGPDVTVWTPTPDGVSGFYARRFTHETAIHRADAELALGRRFTLDPEIAVDGVDEWLELGSLPFHFEIHPQMRELLGPGRTIGLHATDVDTGWIVDLTGDVIAWRRGADDDAVTVSGAVVDLLLLIYKRLAAIDTRLHITGDHDLLDFWLERVDFG